MATLLLASITIVVGAAAQTVSPGTVDPGRQDQRFRPQLTPREASRSPERALLPDAQSLADAEKVRFTVRTVVFEGATRVPADVLQGYAAKYTGHEISLADALHLAREVTAEYRNQGLILSRAIVPPQKVADGVLRIQVVEGYFSEAKVEGVTGAERRRLEHIAQPILDEKPVSAATLERVLLLANDLPGMTVHSVVTASQTTPQAAVLTLVAKEKPLDASVTFDNRGTRWLGPEQVSGVIDLNDLLGTGSRLGIGGAWASDTELGYGVITYDQPLTASGLVLNLAASGARTRPGDELKLIGTKGDAETYSAGLSYPLVRARDRNLYAALGFTERNSHSSNDFFAPVFRDKVRFFKLDLSGDYADSWGGLTNGRLSFEKSVDVFGATGTNDPNKSHATADGDFGLMNFELVHRQPLFAGFALRTAVAGQYSRNSLFASEEFGIGGLFYGRAFDSSEITGDRGAAGSAELSWTPPRPFMNHNWQVYTFYEGGRVWQIHPLPTENRSEAIESAGLGLRFDLLANLHGSVEWAKPLNRDVASRGNRDGRLFFSINASY